jgi:hypothetical protein
MDPGVLVAATDAAQCNYAEFNNDRTRCIVLLRTFGYTHEEIAEMVSATSTRAVEGVFHRLRNTERMRRQQKEADGLGN